LELVIVAALILGLTTLYWGSNGASRQRKQQVLCQQNLQKIFVAMQIYANEQGGKFPEAAGAQTSEAALDRLVPKYTVDTEVFICPGSGAALLPSGESLLKHKISYAYYMGRRATDEQLVLMTDRQVNTNAKSAGQLVFSDTGTGPGKNHGKYGGNLLYGDGHVQLSPAAATVSLPLTPEVVLLNPK
jgi:prepilin-type processing-associated H-X9-DG protein